jgi:hypothetical protein
MITSVAQAVYKYLLGDPRSIANITGFGSLQTIDDATLSCVGESNHTHHD